MDDKELQNLLFTAIQHHNNSLLADLLGVDSSQRLLDIPGDDGNMLLHTAVIENDVRCVECLLKQGADPNVFDANRARTPLHLAVELGHAEIVKAFLRLEHVSLDIRDDRNLTCYEIAQYCDNTSLANLINVRRHEIEELNNEFYSVINQACTSNEPTLVRELLERYEKRQIDKLPQGWLPEKDARSYARSIMKQLINWSSSSWNDVTLLFKSASKGYTEVCAALIEFGATAKCNENTNYSPLYVAAYGGFTPTVKLLLDNFPYLVHEVTIEKWTVLHACCLQGNSETAKLLLDYPFRPELKHQYVSRSGVYEYQFALDLNAQDAAGQTAIYLAVSANDEALLNTLLDCSVEAKILDEHNQMANSRQPAQTIETQRKRGETSNRRARIIPDRMKATVSDVDRSQPKSRVNSQLDRIIKQLRKVDLQGESEDQIAKGKTITAESKTHQHTQLICPFEMDTYCDYNSKTALHMAVRQQYHSMAALLLANGANPNLPILSRDSIKSEFTSSPHTDSVLNWLRSTKSTCLKEACKLNDEVMCEILIRHGASDNQDNLALQVAAANKNTRLISKFLSLKSNVDPEFKINKKCNVEFASRYKQSAGRKLIQVVSQGNTTTFSTMFPSAPVMIDWQSLKCIRHIDPQWLIDASLTHNKRLNHPTTSLMAITRLDLSSNNLKNLHPVIFRLPSLRELNLSNNRLESLLDATQRGSIEGDNVPTSKLIESHKTAMKRSKSSNLTSINLENSNIIDLNEFQEWDLPYLETLDLHDNRLISLPDCLFELPRLTELDVSSNQIRQLPWSMWTAPALKEVIASGNLLDDLPRVPPQTKANLSQRLELYDSPTEEKKSPTPDQSVSTDRPENSFVSGTEPDSTKGNQEFQFSINTASCSTTQLASSDLPIENLNYWKTRVDVVNNSSIAVGQPQSPFSPSIIENLEDNLAGVQEELCSLSKISYLNLSHNSFSKIPPVLACIATELTRLNLSHNRVSTLGNISLYPSSLKNLDLSNNQIMSWFSPTTNDSDTQHCYAHQLIRKGAVSNLMFGYTNFHCSHKTHQRLNALRSINLSHNLLRDIHLSLQLPANNVDSSLQSRLSTSTKDLLAYPNVTALDLSFNSVQSVPKSISSLKDLSVLNLSGNVAISSLPAELGLLSKLWNLGIIGCSLSEPLKSIVESKTYKTMDIIGYLRSILEEAKPYARMKLMLVGLQGIGKTSLLEQMRHEGSSGNRRRAPEHWTKRMGHSSKSNLRNQRGVTLSTVGVDIHDWIYCKRATRNQPSFGPVSFSTWDFGGQHEFYATHRYFLSRRSMYLVVWRLTDGLDGINGIQQWLVNIQSRASGSSVIIVGTHEDMIEGGENGEQVRHLQEELAHRFIDVSDHDKCGLPRVMDSIVVSTKTKLNIKHLCNRIYDVVFSLRCPGSTERLLEQKIPATYLYLEEIINWIVHDRQQKRREPVLNYQEYRQFTTDQMRIKHNKQFRDLEPLNSREINYNSELQQATRFLHENGILLHYEDANLRNLYFLDPQWLCDILSHVVTIREINPHVKNGLMRVDDLGFLFKSMDVNLNGGIQSYVVNLLNKFEVALTWNTQYLLIPSLLPSDPNMLDEQQDFQVKMVPRMRGRSAVRRYEVNRSAGRSASIDPLRAAANTNGVRVEIEQRPDRTMLRLVLLRYLPAGFLARLQSAILSDPAYDDICADLYSHFVHAANGDANLNGQVGSRTGWICWQNGIRLSLQNESTINSRSSASALPAPLLTVQELSTNESESIVGEANFQVQCAQACVAERNNPDQHNSISDLSCIDASSKWTEMDITQHSNIIMISVLNWRLKLTKNSDEESFEYIELEQQSIARLLANSVDHIDNLLEDWYPSLGTRFTHTLGGSYLVTRVIPCPQCMSAPPVTQQRSSRFDSRALKSREISFSLNSAKLNRNRLTEPLSTIPIVSSAIRNEILPRPVYCYYVEHCILSAYDTVATSPNTRPSESLRSKYSLNNLMSHLTSSSPAVSKKIVRGKNLHCPQHGNLSLSSLAPDVIFNDIADDYKIENEQIERCKLIGRGTFGFVFRGSLRSSFPLNQLGHADQEVALKLLQPVDPGPEADSTDVNAYKSAKSNWLREPFQSACKSYCIARHEINILQTLRHPNIVLFIGLCIRPLAIVLELAPLGCLTDIFRNYKRAGMRIDQYSVQKTILQVARALEFLHQQRVIYRDLKAENVLVWSFPSPFATQLQAASVELKLADYGISRQALSTGIWKGFAGTINFLAPEILRHNGDEEYTEKVDCFSFGMFMYELLTLRPPFKHNEGTKSHLADGGRPTLTTRDLIYPNYMLDLMSICWSQEPHNRPTASQIVSIASTPEFMRLFDVISLKSSSSANIFGKVNFSAAVQNAEPGGCEDNLDLWLGRQKSNALEVVSTNQDHWAEWRQFSSDVQHGSSRSDFQLSCLCLVQDKIWICDSDMVIHALPLGSRLKSPQGIVPIASNRSFKTSSKCGNPELNTIHKFPLSIPRRKGLQVQQMIFLKEVQCVVFLLNSGEIWQFRLSNMSSKQLDDGSIHFKCIAIRESYSTSTSDIRVASPTNDQLRPPSRGSYQVFCGQSNGISCLEILEDEICRQSILPLAGRLVDLSGERIVEPSQPTEVTSILVSSDLLWTSAGCTVHLWSLKDKCVARKLDCWKLVPCSESLESINIENYYQQARSSTVSSMVRMSNQLFVGTSHGCFMVVEADSLKPIIVFRPYESNMTIIAPTIVSSGTEHSVGNEQESRFLVTIGTGYRDLMRRYVSCLDGEISGNSDDRAHNEEVAILWSANAYND